MSDASCARQRARSSTFIVSESLFPIRSHGQYYLKVPLGILVESTSRVSPIHYPRWHPFKSERSRSKSQPSNTKLSRQLSGKKGYDDRPDPDMKILDFFRSHGLLDWDHNNFWGHKNTKIEPHHHFQKKEGGEDGTRGKVNLIIVRGKLEKT